LHYLGAAAAEDALVYSRPLMIDTKTLDDVLSAVVRVLPRTPADVERNVRAALAAAFDRLDLVTREELEVQEALLARIQARLKELEAKIATLEGGTPK
jgi:ubiquinone biosynthesis accessory factor UbiK